jgi:hypothetical protein
MVNTTKFKLPLTMFSRAQVESKLRSIGRKKVQSARMAYMNIPQIPSDSENSDDIFEDIKALSLVRTPFDGRKTSCLFNRNSNRDCLQA